MLITGASRGFGAAAARAIAGRGHTVVATMRNPDRDAAAVTAGFEDRIHPDRLDVTVPAEVASVVAATLAIHGRIDVLINNAGYGLYGPAELGAEEQVWRQLDTNTFGAWRMIKAVLPDMRRRGQGKIVNVTSLSGRIVAPMLSHYAATSSRSRHSVRACGSRSARWACRCAPWSPACTPATGRRRTSTSPTASPAGPTTSWSRSGWTASAAWRPPVPARPALPPPSPTSSTSPSRCPCAGRSATRPRVTSPSGPAAPTRSGTGCAAAAPSVRGAGRCTWIRRPQPSTTGRRRTSC